MAHSIDGRHLTGQSGMLLRFPLCLNLRLIDHDETTSLFGRADFSLGHFIC